MSKSSFLQVFLRSIIVKLYLHGSNQTEKQRTLMPKHEKKKQKKTIQRK